MICAYFSSLAGSFTMTSLLPHVTAGTGRLGPDVDAGQVSGVILSSFRVLIEKPSFTEYCVFRPT